MPVILLDQAKIDTGMTPEPGKKRTEWCDRQIPGLYLEARAGSEITTYYLRYKDPAGKTCHQKLGRTDTLALMDARQQAQSLKAALARGEHPGKAQDEARMLTLDGFFQQHYVPFKRGRKRVEKDEDLWRLRLRDRFGAVPLDRLSRVQVQDFLVELSESGLKASTANHYIRLLRHLYNCAITMEIGIVRNPARIPLLPEHNKVEHYLDDDQLASLLRVLRTYGNRPVCLLAMLLLGTGMRLEEGLGLKWSAVDRDKRIIRLEATRTKAKRAHVVPISDMVMAVLNELRTEGRHEYLFVSQKTGERLRYVHKVWGRIRAEAGLPWLRLHDLRHNFASTLINSGESLVTVQVLLNHADISTTAKRYIHLSNKTLGSAAETAGAKFAAAMKAAG